MKKKEPLMNKQTLKEKRKLYLFGTLSSLFFVILSFFSTPSPKLNELNTKNITLTKTPIFKHQRKSYWVELNTNYNKYEINGIDYKYLKHKVFKKKIKKGSKIKIGVKKENVYTLSYKNIEFMNYTKSQIHKAKNKKFIRIVFGTGFISCLIAFLFGEIKYHNHGIETIINFGLIILLLIAISVIVGIINIGGIKYLSGQQFMQ